MVFGRIAGVATVGILALALTGCSGSGGATPTATPTPVKPSGDGILRIGDLAPISGDLATYAAAQAAGIELAAREINDQGGYNSVPVEVLHRNAGDGDAAVTETNFNDLVTRGVDVILAPASGNVAETLQLLVKETKANVAIVSVAVKANAPKDVSVDPVKADDAFTARLKSSDPSVTEFAYGTEFYDLTMASALAAVTQKDDGGASITQGLIAVTGAGIKCNSYGMCLDVLKTEPAIDYVGQAGQINYSATTGVVYFGKTSTEPVPSPKSSKK